MGDGPHLKEIKEKYNEQNVEFLGQTSNMETIKLIKIQKEFYLLQNFMRASQLYFVRLRYVGKASLFPNSGGITEFLQKDYEFVFDQFNYKDLINKLNLLNDDLLREKNSKKAKEFILSKLDENNIIEEFDQVIYEN